MSRHPVSVGGRADAAEFKQELLGRLGLRADASDQDVEAAHNALVEFLELAPHDVKSWATAQTADVDEAFALLSGPEKDLVAPAALAAMAQSGLNDTPPAPEAAPAPTRSAGVNAPEAPAGSATPPTPPKPAGIPFAQNKPLQKKLAWVLAPLLILGIGFGVYSSGKSDVPPISGTPTGQDTAAPGSKTIPVDPAKVSALMKKLSANPKDVASLQGLGDMYFGAGDFKNAALWEQKVVAVDPKNKVGLLALGAADFNQGNTVDAKKQWLTAAALYPQSAEVHYDLGFWYFSQTPPDLVNMRIEWKKVVAIDPTSDLAKTVATHLTSATSGPTATATTK